ncbi:head-tail connector protein [Erythrobacter tepidarius]|uniref:head-tail connector protein n=1 Tax=Erythrobacter tepidarius TaxID=60454 RepID=UPI000A3C4E8B|nr:hypothetical protein [Erythrobacter tepidarius]
MQRIIVQPPVIGGAALAELKHWLAITRPDEDAALAQLLETSVTICEAFTGQSPLHQTIEEIVPVANGWQELAARPVQALVAAAIIAQDGARTPLDEPDLVIELRAAGSACIRISKPITGRAVALQLRVGIAAEWDALPPPLAQGIIRLAAHHYRDRDSKASTVPPASVAALWRPWRQVRLG